MHRTSVAICRTGRFRRITRVGRYLDALADNKTAIGVDEKYLTATNAPMGVIASGTIPTTSISCWRLPRWRATDPPPSRRPTNCVG